MSIDTVRTPPTWHLSGTELDTSLWRTPVLSGKALVNIEAWTETLLHTHEPQATGLLKRSECDFIVEGSVAYDDYHDTDDDDHKANGCNIGYCCLGIYTDLIFRPVHGNVDSEQMFGDNMILTPTVAADLFDLRPDVEAWLHEQASAGSWHGRGWDPRDPWVGFVLQTGEGAQSRPIPNLSTQVCRTAFGTNVIPVKASEANDGQRWTFAEIAASVEALYQGRDL